MATNRCRKSDVPTFSMHGLYTQKYRYMWLKFNLYSNINQYMNAYILAATPLSQLL